jgi:hypothetical protein
MEYDSDEKKIPRRKVRRQGRGTLLNEFVIIPGHGVVSLQTQELTPTHIALIASVYETACRFAENVGGDPDLIRTCREEAAQLLSYIAPDEDVEDKTKTGE